MAGTLRILYIDADTDDRPLLDIVLHNEELRRAYDDVELVMVAEAGALAAALADPDYDLVVVGDHLGWVEGLDLIGPLRTRNSGTPILLFALGTGEERVAAAMRRGLGGYLAKRPGNFARLPQTLLRLLADANAPRTAEAAATDGALAEMLGSSGVAYFRCNADGRLLQANAAFLRLLGLEHDAAEGESLNLHAFTQRPGDWTRLMRRLHREAEIRETGWPLRRADGQAIQVELSARLRDTERPEVVVEALIEARGAGDAGERRRLQARLEELERSNADLQEMASIASHELQAPLRTVDRFTKLLRDEARDKLNGSTGEFMRFILEGTERMQGLVEDLLTYSRLGRAEAPRELVDGEALLRQAKTALGAAIEESHAIITNDPLPKVYGNPAQLASLFENLIGNAIKFRAESAPRIHVSARRTGDAWTIAVSDNGIGIAPDDVDRVFEVFYRPAASADRPGTGIGLALCRKIVEAHRGAIRVESRPGEGSTFLFSLPSQPADSEALAD